jgi:hypothetical protein
MSGQVSVSEVQQKTAQSGKQHQIGQQHPSKRTLDRAPSTYQIRGVARNVLHHHSNSGTSANG